jgi:methyl-accepting chemotaxis protein
MRTARPTATRSSTSARWRTCSAPCRRPATATSPHAYAPAGTDLIGDIQRAFNQMAERNAALNRELDRVGRVVGREGRMTERASLGNVEGGWATSIESVNSLIDDLIRPSTEVALVMEAVARGDLNRKMALTIEGQPVKGEFARIGTTVNQMVDQLSSFADEVTRVAREVGTEGQLGGQAKVKGARARGRTSPTR